MIEASDALMPGAHLRADVAVVGAGPAGIVAALELARVGIDVVLLESGFQHYDRPLQGLSDAESWDQSRHAPMQMAIRRQVGGTSTIWGGRCVPYDAIDFESRPVVGGSLWPVSYAELERFFDRACRWMVCGRPVFAGAGMSHLPPSIVPGLADEDVTTSTFERWSLPTNFGAEYGDALGRCRSLRLFPGLTCTQVIPATATQKVARLVAKRIDGAEVSVSARHYVLAGGGLETTRLLLSSPGPDGTPIGDHSGHLGRWYMGHVEGIVANVHFATPPRATIVEYERDVDGVYVRRRFALTADAQRRLDIPNIAGWLANPSLGDASHHSGTLSLAYLLLASPLGGFLAPPAQRLSLTGLPVPGSPYWPSARSPYRRHVANAVRHPREASAWMISFGARRFLARGRKAPGFFVRSRMNSYPLQFHGEHLPHRNSRVTLGAAADRLGRRRLHIDLRFTDADVDGVMRWHQHVDSHLRRRGLGRVEYTVPDPRAAMLENIGGGFHQVGTTRMSAEPEAGVVDGDLSVHGYSDLHVLGSSTFPTSSQANSTFMIVAFACRLADHLRSRLR